MQEEVFLPAAEIKRGRMNIILLGAPGAGKGTQAKKISEAYRLPHISTGDIFRANIKSGTELGLLAKSYMDKGDLVPDEVVIAIVNDRIKQKDCEGGYLLDGFPRTIAQAEALSKITKIDYVIDIEVPERVLLERLTGRRVCGKCSATYNIDSLNGKTTCSSCGGQLIHRTDDTEEVVASRLQVYTKQTAPLIDYYKQRKVLQEIQSNNIIEDTYKKIEKILNGNR